jgi:hypothetical protein
MAAQHRRHPAPSPHVGGHPAPSRAPRRPRALEAAPWPINSARIPLMVHASAATLLPAGSPSVAPASAGSASSPWRRPQLLPMAPVEPTSSGSEADFLGTARPRPGTAGLSGPTACGWGLHHGRARADLPPGSDEERRSGRLKIKLPCGSHTRKNKVCLSRGMEVISRRESSVDG